jgi:hypothetical protein
LWRVALERARGARQQQGLDLARWVRILVASQLKCPLQKSGGPFLCVASGSRLALRMRHPRDQGGAMTAFNVVRFRVKPGQQDAFVNEHRNMKADFPGMQKFSLIKTGERTFCVVGEWKDMSSLVNARPAMIAQLDRMRGMLEDLGGGLGVTDPVSGDAVVELSA